MSWRWQGAAGRVPGVSRRWRARDEALGYGQPGAEGAPGTVRTARPDIIHPMSSTNVIRVAVHGAAGEVGREVVKAAGQAEDMELVAAIDRVPAQEAPAFPEGVPYYTDVGTALAASPADVVVDFTTATASMAMVSQALDAGARPVIGTTGILAEQLAQLDTLCREHHLGGLYAPNFTIGAVLLGRLAAVAARFFDYVEIAEEHHEAKIDAPSGTALAIAGAIREGRPTPFRRNVPEREPLPGTRGGEEHGISIHSSRMQGRMAHHQVTFGGPGQTLTLRHDTINRECYMPGVLLAVRRVHDWEGLVVGLDRLLDL